jgi:hypothetical protein
LRVPFPSPPATLTPFGVDARHSVTENCAAAEFTSVGNATTLGQRRRYRRNALTAFRESQTLGDALPEFSSAHPPKVAPQGPPDRRRQGPVFRHFSVMGPCIKT